MNIFDWMKRERYTVLISSVRVDLALPSKDKQSGPFRPDISYQCDDWFLMAYKRLDLIRALMRASRI